MVLLVLQLMEYCLREKSVLDHFNVKVNEINASFSSLKYFQSWKMNINIFWGCKHLNKSTLKHKRSTASDPVNNSGRKYVKDTLVVCYTQWKHFHLKTKLKIFFLIVENYSGTLKLSSAVVKEVLFMLWNSMTLNTETIFFLIKEESELNLSC